MLSSEPLIKPGTSKLKHKPFKLEIDADVIPYRTVAWEEENGLVRLKVQKFDGRLGKWLCQALRKPNYAIVNLDQHGSFIWIRCDGSTTVGNILNQLKDELGEGFEKEGIEPRSYFFLYMIRNRGLLTWQETPNGSEEPQMRA